MKWKENRVVNEEEEEEEEEEKERDGSATLVL